MAYGDTYIIQIDQNGKIRDIDMSVIDHLGGIFTYANMK